MPKIYTGDLGGQYIKVKGEKKYLCSMTAKQRMELYRTNKKTYKKTNRFG
jgi:hypothetical protein